MSQPLQSLSRMLHLLHRRALAAHAIVELFCQCSGSEARVWLRAFPPGRA
jgi:hypothetical protein